MITCELKDKIFAGNCEACSDKVYCILKELLEKINKLENTIEALK